MASHYQYDDRIGVSPIPAHSFATCTVANCFICRDFHDSFAEDSECAEDMLGHELPPGAAIAMWVREHTPAMVLGLIFGAAGVLVPAIIVAWWVQ